MLFFITTASKHRSTLTLEGDSNKIKYRLTATWLMFRCWPMLINPFTDCFHRAKLPTFCQKFYSSCSVSKNKFPQCLNPSFIFVQYFTHNQCCRPNCGYDLKYWTIYYSAMLHINIKISPVRDWRSTSLECIGVGGGRGYNLGPPFTGMPFCVFIRLF